MMSGSHVQQACVAVQRAGRGAGAVMHAARRSSLAARQRRILQKVGGQYLYASSSGCCAPMRGLVWSACGGADAGAHQVARSHERAIHGGASHAIKADRAAALVRLDQHSVIRHRCRVALGGSQEEQAVTKRHVAQCSTRILIFFPAGGCVSHARRAREALFVTHHTSSTRMMAPRTSSAAGQPQVDSAARIVGAAPCSACGVTIALFGSRLVTACCNDSIAAAEPPRNGFSASMLYFGSTTSVSMAWPGCASDQCQIAAKHAERQPQFDPASTKGSW